MTTTAQTMTHVDLNLPMGLVGFPAAQRFRLTESEGGLYEMDCLDVPDMGFVVVVPSPYFPEYSPVIDPETAQRLELESADDALVLLLVNLGSEEEPPGANLLAPVVVNKRTKNAMQVVLVNQELPLRAAFPTS
ncbi:flagellar assembly protein FliW [Agilicoccus flavus]|uniref:flagellar assembly protein FliW n=1 Tax=Agilicoccus flavus TaxID=2775968 RepID=UPI001CF646BB|nr:flagellar assembly protein FliW [Agilicoccus flavus]